MIQLAVTRNVFKVLGLKAMEQAAFTRQCSRVSKEALPQDNATRCHKAMQAQQPYRHAATRRCKASNPTSMLTQRDASPATLLARRHKAMQAQHAKDAQVLVPSTPSTHRVDHVKHQHQRHPGD